MDEQATFGARVREISKPIARRRLLDPVSARERMEVIDEERAALYAATRVTTSLRMKDAILLQADYLDPNSGNLQRGVELFLKTRGRTGKLEVLPFERMQVQALPLIVVGPVDLAGVVLGYANIDGDQFAYVFFPRTSTPTVESVAQWMSELRDEAGLPPEPNYAEQVNKGVQKLRELQENQRKSIEAQGKSYSPPERDPERMFREGMERGRAFYESFPIVRDRRSTLPASAQDGVHLVRCSTMASWRAFYLAGIEVGDNWGQPARRGGR